MSGKEEKKQSEQTERKDKYIISKESAISQINYWFDRYDFDLDDFDLEDGKDNIGRAGLIMSRNRLVKKIMKGRISIEDRDGRPYVLQYPVGKYNGFPDVIEYGPVTAIKKIAFPDDSQCRNDEERNIRIAEILSNVSEPKAFNKLEMSDLSTVELLSIFFRTF